MSTDETKIAEKITTLLRKHPDSETMVLLGQHYIKSPSHAWEKLITLADTILSLEVSPEDLSLAIENPWIHGLAKEVYPEWKKFSNVPNGHTAIRGMRYGQVPLYGRGGDYSQPSATPSSRAVVMKDIRIVGWM